ncbi:hypothetical protein [Actibacterium sp.]|jgi:hypothetical protein|uniref:hypothetical protein n=1 Tax=Actibacterium sp. TaxID=1872125 RepID=UPI00257BC2BB|nr:hypothetical protein [Actibacterium sp.]|tara:strand:- start:242 stop:493 length:252 start_codon:yes stop_codon:yes gene_type:complete
MAQVVHIGPGASFASDIGFGAQILRGAIVSISDGEIGQKFGPCREIHGAVGAVQMMRKDWPSAGLPRPDVSPSGRASMPERVR